MERVALVTGTSKGIGKYLTQQLVACGYQVIGCSREAVDWSLDGYHHVCADVSNEGQVKALVDYIRTTFERLDIAINNAGIARMNHTLFTPGVTLDSIMNTNFRGTFLISRECAKLMRKAQFGRIINLSSVAVPMLLEGEAVYAASKSAVETLTRIMSREVAAWGITINAIGPTPIETDLIKNVPQDKIKAIVERLAIKRLGQFSDIWNVIEFLIKPESNYITGQVIYLGGA